MMGRTPVARHGIIRKQSRKYVSIVFKKYFCRFVVFCSCKAKRSHQGVIAASAWQGLIDHMFTKKDVEDPFQFPVW